MDLFELEEKLNELLEAKKFLDSSINGIQVEGKKKIKKVATGVSASVALFKKASNWKADAIIVHHGLLWKNMDIRIYASLKERLKILISNDISLLVYHLPLDAHPDIGNNAQIGKKLGFKDRIPFGEYKGNIIGFLYYADISIDDLLKKLKEIFGEPVIHIKAKKEKLKRIAIISGGAQKEFLQVQGKDIDCFITGEVSEFVFELAKEINCHFISAGHYRTEKFGIKALTKKLNEWGLEAKFFEVPNIF